MFDIELKVNGALTMNIHGRNVTPDYTTNPFEDPRPRQTDDYTYEVYNVGSRQLICGTVKHHRDEGLTKLVEIILKNYHKKI